MLRRFIHDRLYQLLRPPHFLPHALGYGAGNPCLATQLAVFKRKRPRPPVRPLDRLFWLAMRHCWSRWKAALIMVQPKTVIGWHRAGFRSYWRWRSRHRPGRPRITAEIRDLIRCMAQENSRWEAPRIHGELLKLGFSVAKSTVASYLRRSGPRRDGGQSWRAFLQNHREAILGPGGRFSALRSHA